VYILLFTRYGDASRSVVGEERPGKDRAEDS
jgi:hypothetical protein